MADTNPFGIEFISDNEQVVIDDQSDDFASVTDPSKIEKINEEKKEPKEKAPIKKEEVKQEEPVDPSLIPLKEEELSTPEKEQKQDKEEDTSDNSFEVYSDALYEMGIFKPYLDDDGNEVKVAASSEEEFKQMWQEQFQNSVYEFAEKVFNSRGPEVRAIFDALYNSGVDPREYIPVAKNIQDFSNISTDDLQNEGVAEKVVRESFKRLGFTEDTINKKIDRLKTNSQLEEEAEDALPVIVEQDKQKLVEIEQKAKQKEAEQKSADQFYKNSIVKILNEKIKTKDFDGIPVTDKTANKAFDFLYTKKWKSNDGKQLTDFDKFIADLNRPENYLTKVKAGLLFMNNLDLSKIQQKALSTETNSLFNRLKGKEIKQQRKQIASQDDDWE